MIIKSLSRKSNGTQLISYVLRYGMKEKINQHRADATIILRHHLRSTTFEDILKEFKQNELYRIYHSKNNVRLYHDIVSFAPASRNAISKTNLIDIAKKYVELRSPDSLCLVIHHAEKQHHHLHCIAAGVKLNGYSNRLSKQEFRSLKLELEKFQQEKYPELDASKINHDRSQTKEAIIAAVNNIRHTEKQKLHAILQQTFSIAQSQQDFLKRLSEQQYKPYYRNSRLQGVLIDDRKFRFSTLGFDVEKFKELDTREVEQKTLTELSDIRKSKPRQIKNEKTHLPKTNDKEELKLLEELQTLRNDTARSQLQERVIDIDDCDLPKVPSVPGMKTVDDINPYFDIEYDFDDV